MVPEGKDYRTLRRAFIAACEAAHADPIARVHPAKAPDGRPLFTDSLALGPRDATRALLVLSSDAKGSHQLTQLLQEGVTLPPGMRLVLVHALDPAALAGAAPDSRWCAATLAAIATEDMAKVANPSVLALDEASRAAAAQSFPDSPVMPPSDIRAALANLS